MASKTETGIAKTIANLNLLNTSIAAMGTSYAPTNPNLALAKLKNTYTLAHQKQREVNALQGPYSLAVDNRERLFMPLNKELTKLCKAYKATEGVTAAEMEDLMTIIRKLKGDRRSKPKKTENTEEAQMQHSVSHLSYDQRTNNMDLLISLLRNTPNYDPNEEQYKVSTYEDKKAAMLEATKAVADVFIPLNKARSERDKVLYDDNDGLVALANKAKEYIGTVLDTASPQYKAVARIKFRNK